VDLIASGQGVEVLGFVQVPKHGGAILATGGAKGAVGGNGDGVDVASVPDVVGLNAAGGELPDLNRRGLSAPACDWQQVVKVICCHQYAGECLSHGQ